MKRRVIFRADGGKTTGYGHFVRSLALAGYLKNHFNCSFATFNPGGDYCGPSDFQLKEIQRAEINPFEVSGSNLKEFDLDFLKQLQPNDIVVLDNYYFTTEYQKEIRKRGCKLVCIDDVHNRHMVCDLLITVCPLKREDFSVEDYTEFLGGIENAFLREPFFSPSTNRASTDGINNILIGMGGADAFNLTDKMIEIIHSVIPDACIHAICGETVKVKTTTRTIATIHNQVSADEIVRLMDKADIGVFPASTICLEALSRNLPVVAGYYVDNQEELYKYGKENRFFVGLGNLLDEPSEIEDRLSQIFSQPLPDFHQIDFTSQKLKIINLFKAL